MSLEVELDFDGVLSSSKQDEMVIDTEESNSILRFRGGHFTEYDSKDLEESEFTENEISRRHHHHKSRGDVSDNYYNLDIIKQKELMQHLEELKREHAETVNTLELKLDRISRENERYESQLTALKQHNEYLTEASNSWHARYKETNLLLLNAKDEIINLKTELTNLQLSYEEDVKQIKTDNKILLDQTSEELDVNQELQQYMRENLEIRKENKRYLDQLKQINEKYRESNTKYDDLYNIQMDLQNELNISKVRITELTDIVQEYFHEIQSMEQHNAELKQTLGELELQQNTKGLYDSDGNAIEISYAPDTAVGGRKKGRFRARSYSEVSAVSYNDGVCASPVVNLTMNGDATFQFAGFSWHDLYDDDNLGDDSKSDEEDDDVDQKSDEMEKFYDLYETMSDYLFQLSECVQTIKTIKLLHRRRSSLGMGLNAARASNHSLTTKFRTGGDGDEDTKDEEEGESRVRAEDDVSTDLEIDTEDETEDELMTETLNAVLDNNEEQLQLAKMHEVIQQSKDCINELQKQQMIVMAEERTKYDDLDATYKHYQIKTKRKIKRMTKDMYKTQYKKYGGYRQICWEMFGNVGTYTKDAIIYRLTH